MKSEKARFMRALLFVDAVGISAKGGCASLAQNLRPSPCPKIVHELFLRVETILRTPLIFSGVRIIV
jgi:hypothetical protein